MTQKIILKKDGEHLLLKNAPATCGVYIFYADATPIYVGKSINIKARLRSHAQAALLDAREGAIIQTSTRVVCLPTTSEFDALMLEARLIQQYRPRYNRAWKDDKSYLYIKIPPASLNLLPTITLARKPRTNEDVIRGRPRTNEDVIRGRPRTNEDVIRGTKYGSTSLTTSYYGPLPSVAVAETILREVRKLVPFCTQKKIGPKPCFHSTIGLCRPCPSEIIREKDPVVKEQLSRQYRSQVRQVVNILDGKTDRLLAGLRKQLKYLASEQKFEEALLLRDRIWSFEQFMKERLDPQEWARSNFSAGEAGHALRHLLIPHFPQLTAIERVECYDVSNLSRREATAAMTVWQNGLVDKSQYRKFRLRDPAARSDFEMLTETFTRRFKHDWPRPSLFVVDGGRPQVRTALQVLAGLNVQIPVIGIAKHPDRLVLGLPDLPTLRPRPNHPGFNLVRELRDEAHRFSRKYHLLLRSRRLTTPSRPPKN